jgi:UDP-N-acetylglucosamine transferase subunit ALG13
MVRAVDEWAGSRGRTDVFAQIGKARYEPQHMDAVPFLSPSEFRERVRAARLLVAHAGMGSIITALEAGKPIMIMPKWARLGEHRSDHQVATAKRLGQKPGIIVAWDEEDLIVKLDREGGLCAPETIAREASPELIAAIREFLSRRELPVSGRAGESANGWTIEKWPRAKAYLQTSPFQRCSKQKGLEPRAECHLRGNRRGSEQ